MQKPANQNELSEINVKKLSKYLPDKNEDASAYIELVKKQVMGNKGTLLDLTYFLRVAKNARLDPTLRQIYAIFRRNKIGDNQWEDKMTIQSGIDGLRAGAETTKQYAGTEEPIFGEDQEYVYNYEYKGKKYQKKITVPSYAKVTVLKLMDGQVFKTVGRADFDEFYPGDKLGNQWRKMPKVMLAKCAEAQALRKAFPIISGIYIDEEMQQLDSQDNENIPEGETVFELSDKEIAPIDKTKTKEELLKVCGEIRKKKGDKYLDSIMVAYKRNKLRIEEQLRLESNVKETK